MHSNKGRHKSSEVRYVPLRSASKPAAQQRCFRSRFMSAEYSTREARSRMERTRGWDTGRTGAIGHHVVPPGHPHRASPPTFVANGFNRSKRMRRVTRRLSKLIRRSPAICVVSCQQTGALKPLPCRRATNQTPRPFPSGIDEKRPSGCLEKEMNQRWRAYSKLAGTASFD